MNALQSKHTNNIINGRTICLSISRDNRRVVEILNDYALDMGLSMSGTIFRIIQDYHTYKLLEKTNENT